MLWSVTAACNLHLTAHALVTTGHYHFLRSAGPGFLVSGLPLGHIAVLTYAFEKASQWCEIVARGNETTMERAEMIGSKMDGEMDEDGAVLEL